MKKKFLLLLAPVIISALSCGEIEVCGDNSPQILVIIKVGDVYGWDDEYCASKTSQWRIPSGPYGKKPEYTDKNYLEIDFSHTCAAGCVLTNSYIHEDFQFLGDNHFSRLIKLDPNAMMPIQFINAVFSTRCTFDKCDICVPDYSNQGENSNYRTHYTADGMNYTTIYNPAPPLGDPYNPLGVEEIRLIFEWADWNTVCCDQA